MAANPTAHDHDEARPPSPPIELTLQHTAADDVHLTRKDDDGDDDDDAHAGATVRLTEAASPPPLPATGAGTGAGAGSGAGGHTSVTFSTVAGKVKAGGKHGSSTDTPSKKYHIGNFAHLRYVHTMLTRSAYNHAPLALHKL